MSSIVLVYATRQGQTRKIAEHLAEALAPLGLDCQAVDVCGVEEPFPLAAYEGAILAASIHMGKHEPEMVDFVRRHREELEAMPTAFLSVSMSEASAEDPTRSFEERERARAEVEQMLEAFYAATDWRPGRALPVAGALLYTKMGFILRFVTKRIARRDGGPTDTTHDYEFTDWAALDHFAEELVARIARLRDSRKRGAGPQLPR
jgi:menaquinone-dependent protoporphyrinogen oxidase